MSCGLRRGDRLAVLSENRREYLEIEMACAKTGVIAACLNWRMSDEHLGHCARLVDPRLLIVSERYAERGSSFAGDIEHVVELGDQYEGLLSDGSDSSPVVAVEPEDGLLILYTSGTTGLPKGVLISHRAMVWRAALYMAETHITRDDCFVAWSPLFHMAGSDYAIGTMLLGGKVVLVDGVDLPRLLDVIQREQIGYLPVVSGMIDRLAEALKAENIRPRGIRLIGAMADLVPPDRLAEITTLLGAPFLNSFGMTEVGTGPASGNTIGVGEKPTTLAKRESTFCLVRLVDDQDDTVAPGELGEAVVRGPSLFTEYWNDPEATTAAFRGGWFHTGDVFVRHDDGGLDWVERTSFMIKSGGENIFAQEVEKVIMSHPLVELCAVIGVPDPLFVEAVMALIVLKKGAQVTEEEILDLCKKELSSYKKPRRIVFVDSLPMNESGKILKYKLREQYSKR